MKFVAPPCSCNGPSCSTDHAPDCAINLAWDDFREEKTQTEYEAKCAVEDAEETS